MSSKGRIMASQIADKPVFLVFVGAIDQAGVHRLAQAMNAALTDQHTAFHIMLQSAGGTVGDGVALYEIFRALPVAVTTYNCGQVCSAAVIAYLGGEERLTSTTALFMIHPTHFSPQFAFSGMLGQLAQTAALEDARIEQIYSRHLKLTEEQRAIHAASDLWLGAEDALKVGLATGIGGFQIPVGTRPYFV
jgi:ATP-dependent Clp protease protease subunit